MTIDVSIIGQPIKMVAESDVWQISLAISSILIAGITAGALWIQIRKQSKVSSADLVLKLLQPWREPLIQQLLVEIYDTKVKQYDESNLEKFLNQLEDIATFWKDGTLNETHVKEFFGANLKAIRDDDFIQKYMKKWTDQNPDFYFVNLTKLIKKVEKWKI